MRTDGWGDRRFHFKEFYCSSGDNFSERIRIAKIRLYNPKPSFLSQTHVWETFGFIDQL